MIVGMLTMKSIEAPAVEVLNFTKNYGDFAAVRELSFTVQPGRIVGIVGANGAGKTTTLRAITGILRPTAGRLRIGGWDIEQDPVAAKGQFAYVPDTIHAYDLLTVTEHLHFVALAYRVPNAEANTPRSSMRWSLGRKRTNWPRTSRGGCSKAVAGLRVPARASGGDLDEPLTGLDPRGIRNIKESIRRRAAAGTSFLLSSHLLVLVEALCDEVLILHRGRKMAFGSLEEIRDRARFTRRPRWRRFSSR